MNVLARTIAALGGFGDRALLLWGREPVVITGLATVLVNAAIAFGAPIDDGQKTAIIAVVSSLGIVIARSQVTPA